MNNRIVFVFILAALLISCSNNNDSIKVVSLNIRYDNPADGINAWPGRRDIVTDFIDREQPDLFGLQEVLWHQYTYIDSAVTGWGSIAAGRDDGLRGGEMTPLFYREELFFLNGSGTFWLSETPDVPGSRGWGAVLPRIVTWASLTCRDNGDTIYFFNTHFSHMSDSARIMSSGILREQVAVIAGDKPFIITGDFNMLPGSSAYNKLAQLPVTDSYKATLQPPAGELYTFNGFKNIPGEGRIDYIFASKGITILSHNTVAVKRDSIFISDHWPVIVTLLKE